MRITTKTMPEIEAVWLFGSYAEQRAKDESDIDLAIVSPLFGEDYPKALSLAYRALWELPGVPSIH
ncbi:MAG: nucleotidyltransferase domain-containing protein, partial [Bacilli bacterium]